jgi:hypothetical protein
MAVGDLTPGKRRPDGTEPHELEIGEYSKIEVGLWIRLPNGDIGHIGKGWNVTWNADGSATVSPSIKTHGENNWHGYLENGVWREV